MLCPIRHLHSTEVMGFCECLGQLLTILIPVETSVMLCADCNS